MRIWEVLLIAVVLSLDAFSVSVCKSLAMDRVTVGKMCIVGAWFGVFQALMPTIGYFIGAVFESYVEAVSGIIAFILLASFTEFKQGEIPITFILVAVIFIGQQVYDCFAVKDNISNMAHIVGGIVGGTMGYILNRKS